MVRWQGWGEQGGYGVQDMQCRRCGRCCYVHLIAYVTEEDLRRWQQEGRRDILTVLERGHVAWAGDRILSMDRGFFSHVCPFLTVEWGNAPVAFMRRDRRSAGSTNLALRSSAPFG